METDYQGGEDSNRLTMYDQQKHHTDLWPRGWDGGGPGCPSLVPPLSVIFFTSRFGGTGGEKRKWKHPGKIWRLAPGKTANPRPLPGRLYACAWNCRGDKSHRFRSVFPLRPSKWPIRTKQLWHFACLQGNVTSKSPTTFYSSLSFLSLCSDPSFYLFVYLLIANC